MAEDSARRHQPAAGRKNLIPATTFPSDLDFYLFEEGTHFRQYEMMGAHPGADGTSFAVWAPNAYFVSVVGDFNGWNEATHPLTERGNSGVWTGKIAGARVGMKYKYHIRSHVNGYRVNKADPFGFQHETPPLTASVITDLAYDWKDAAWMKNRPAHNSAEAPWSVYEVHLGSWRRVPEQGDRSLTYRELAQQLPAYVKKMGFTHVEFMPVTEHPFYGSWGYQTTGYFAPTSRQGTPADFMRLVDALHQNGIGVILDWVPSHFPTDEHGLGFFDGTHLYEHADPRQGFHPDWKSCIFNFGRKEVRSFLIASALFWLDKYHIDGLRVDGVASMLYLNYSRRHGDWIPNKYGGNQNLEAIEFLQSLNTEVYKFKPDVQTIAEESTAWPNVSRPTYVGGLGFGMKWDMGWMHDALTYMEKDPIYRAYHQNMITFRNVYAQSERFMLPFSHDEVVYGKGSLLGKMPGDEWQKFANLRALLALTYGQPGKKLLFMGAEFGQWNEWNHDHSLDWHLTDQPAHAGLQKFVADLNRVYSAEPALHSLDFDPMGFEMNMSDASQSVLIFTRRGARVSDLMLIAVNLTPKPQFDYVVGVRRDGAWDQVLNSDDARYGGGGLGDGGSVIAEMQPHGDFPFRLRLTIPPLGAVFLKSPGIQL
jgi:1,4-alpha-glucan branching enzyme